MGKLLFLAIVVLAMLALALGGWAVQGARRVTLSYR
jgi:hypothetical protein